ncbi:MAG: cyclic pyranopterin monophosphate synthase MoaC [Bacillota bacterium]
MSGFSHIDQDGQAKMVDVTDKNIARREAVAAGRITMMESTLDIIKNGDIEKDAVLETARIAGIMAAKNTSDIIPMCYKLMISGIDVEFESLEVRKWINVGEKNKREGNYA